MYQELYQLIKQESLNKEAAIRTLASMLEMIKESTLQHEFGASKPVNTQSSFVTDYEKLNKGIANKDMWTGPKGNPAQNRIKVNEGHEGYTLNQSILSRIYGGFTRYLAARRGRKSDQLQK